MHSCCVCSLYNLQKKNHLSEVFKKVILLLLYLQYFLKEHGVKGSSVNELKCPRCLSGSGATLPISPYTSREHVTRFPSVSHCISFISYLGKIVSLLLCVTLAKVCSVSLVMLMVLSRLFVFH